MEKPIPRRVSAKRSEKKRTPVPLSRGRMVQTEKKKAPMPYTAARMKEKRIRNAQNFLKSVGNKAKRTHGLRDDSQHHLSQTAEIHKLILEDEKPKKNLYIMSNSKKTKTNGLTLKQRKMRDKQRLADMAPTFEQPIQMGPPTPPYSVSVLEKKIGMSLDQERPKNVVKGNKQFIPSRKSFSKFAVKPGFNKQQHSLSNPIPVELLKVSPKKARRRRSKRAPPGPVRRSERLKTKPL